MTKVAANKERVNMQNFSDFSSFLVSEEFIFLFLVFSIKFKQLRKKYVMRGISVWLNKINSGASLYISKPIGSVKQNCGVYYCLYFSPYQSV